MTTFRNRLTVALSVATAVFMSVLCVTFYLWCRSAFLADLDGDLQAIFRADFKANSQSAVTAASTGSAGAPSSFADWRVFKALVNLDGQILQSNSEGGIKLDLSRMNLRSVVSGGPQFDNLASDAGLFRILSSPVKLRDQVVVEVLGISQEPMQEALDELLRALALALLVGICLVALISNKIAGYLTRPLDTILSQLESVTSSGDSALRLTGQYNYREIVLLKREVNAMLEKLDQSLRVQQQFVSNASHELRAPLANLTLAIEVCLRRPRSAEDYLEVLQTCHGESQRLNKMATQLLALSESDEGALNLLKEPTEIEQLLRGCFHRHQVRANTKGLTLELSSCQRIAEVDPIKIGQVVDNLLDNAIRHSPQGGKVVLSCSASADVLEIKVQDEGPGMPQEQIVRLFERFYRADPSRQRGTGGAGLGLAICDAIARAHGGEIAVESQLGQGTKVVIRLPLETLPVSQE